jgi:uncharacterized membrane protein YdjX (TVP38/TMEM64 family)
MSAAPVRVDRGNLAPIVFILFIAVVIGAFLFTPLGDWLTIAKLKESRDWLVGLVEARPLLSGAAFFLFCVVLTAACFPAAPILGVSAGALFGLWTGLALMLSSWALGSTIAFFNARYFLRAWVKNRFGKRVEAIDRGMEAHGALYLLTLRLNPVIPYWLVNLAMGLTSMRPWTYVALTIPGLLPAASIYANAGTQLATIEKPSDILSFNLIVTLLLLSFFPLIVAGGSALYRRARA